MNFATRNASSSTSPAATATGGSFSMGRRTLGVGLAATVLAAGAYAYTGANTVADSFAGEGDGTISGYDVSAVQYTLDGTDPSRISSVSFTLDASASTVTAKIDAGAHAPCNSTNADNTAWECTFTDTPTVGAAGNLNVIAAS